MKTYPYLCDGLSGILLVRCFWEALTGKRTAKIVATPGWSRTGLSSAKTAQRTVSYLGDAHDRQACSWRKTLEVFEEDRQSSRNLNLFPEDR
ncbi:MAG TPA: hypothetical protein VKV15_09350 [Bryobacteraceae bacterium]|nr:hypothetical protein [Bryobacteraceae bacterium]